MRHLGRQALPRQGRFNPRTRVGCDKSPSDEMRLGHVFQSTHPCGVRPDKDTRKALWAVSIHAPVWGATAVFAFCQRWTIVSIHAPVWGATCAPSSLYWALMFQSTHPCGVRQAKIGRCVWWSRFNPRTRVGCDQAASIQYSGCYVSIHAPVWGATAIEDK